MTVPRKTRGQHHHGDLRRALLQAVADLVLEAGPDAVTLRECARRAGVSHSAAAPHFGDKRGLLTAFAAEGAGRLAEAQRDALAALAGPASAAARLAATGRGYIAFARANPGHFRLMFRTELIDRADPAWLAATEAAFAPLAETMRALVPGIGDAALRARLSLAWCAVHGFCTLQAEGVGGELWRPGDRAAETAEAMIALLVAACGAGQPP